MSSANLIGDSVATPSGWRYVAAATFVLTVTAVMFFVPGFIINESVYLVPPRQLHDPAFLINDWTVGGKNQNHGLAVAFAWLMAPIFTMVDDSLVVALVGRLAAWIAIVASIAVLCRTMRIKPSAFAVGCAFWVASGQSFAAGEWVIGGVEQKVPAYAFLLLALAFLLRRNFYLAGLACGVSIAFHVLVGGWGAMALTAAALFGKPAPGRDDMARFVGSAALVGGPFFIAAIASLTGASPAGYDDAAAYFEQLVVFRNPHHLDPAYFFSGIDVIKVLVLCISIWLIVTTGISADFRRPLLVFLGTSLAIFALGLIARPLDWFRFLYFYPFRLADGLVPLIFWIGAMHVLFADLHHARATAQQHGALLAGRAAFLLCVAAFFAHDVPTRFVDGARTTVAGWKARIDGSLSNYDAMARWIRDETPSLSVFAVPPCQDDFWLKAERAMVVNFKLAPPSGKYVEWQARLEALNGGHPFRETGFDVCTEVSGAFSKLSATEIENLRVTYKADYYLSPVPRPGLGLRLIHVEGPYHLYGFNDLTRSPHSH